MAENIQELSKQTLRNYLDKAGPERKSIENSALSQIKSTNTGRKFANRTKGIDRATTKVNNEETVQEKYIGFDKLKKKLAGKGVKNPAAVAASIGRKKYGKEKFQKAAAKGKKMHENVNQLISQIRSGKVDNLRENLNKVMEDKANLTLGTLKEEIGKSFLKKKNIQELSGDTLASYAGKAKDDAAMASISGDKKKALKRLQGHEKAVNKLDK